MNLSTVLNKHLQSRVLINLITILASVATTSYPQITSQHIDVLPQHVRMVLLLFALHMVMSSTTFLRVHKSFQPFVSADTDTHTWHRCRREVL